MPKIHLPQRNLTLDAPIGENLMLFLKAAGVPVASSCMAEGICGKCRLRITGNLSTAGKLERETLERNKIDSGLRLSCLISIESDLVVEASYW